MWPDNLDAVLAAPDSHRILLKNAEARALEITIEPGAREPEHTHRWPSMLIIDAPARIRYYEHGDLTFESPPGRDARPLPRVESLGPEGPHAVENVDNYRYHAIRVEMRPT
jgi:hypothetical protein